VASDNYSLRTVVIDVLLSINFDAILYKNLFPFFGVSGKGNRFTTRWQQNYKAKGHPSPRSQAYSKHFPSSRPHSFLIGPSL
jgi:hypothetical protein